MKKLLLITIILTLSGCSTLSQSEKKAPCHLASLSDSGHPCHPLPINIAAAEYSLKSAS